MCFTNAWISQEKYIFCYLIDVDDVDEDCWLLVGTYSSDENGYIDLSGLEIIGVYRLVETAVSDESYLLPTGQWMIEFNYGNLDGDSSLIQFNDTEVKITGISNPLALSLVQSVTEEDEDELYLYNSKGYDIPTTG